MMQTIIPPTIALTLSLSAFIHAELQVFAWTEVLYERAGVRCWLESVDNTTRVNCGRMPPGSDVVFCTVIRTKSVSLSGTLTEREVRKDCARPASVATMPIEKLHLFRSGCASHSTVCIL
jgi:hypothetical protein